MRDETLLDRAVSNFRYALKNYRTLSGDEVELNFIGYSLQQSCELAIKHFMEMDGIRYAHTHVIEDLLDECEEKGVAIDFSQEFYAFSPAISRWEANTRYIKNFVLAKRQVEMGIGLIKKFLLSNGVKEADLEVSYRSLRDQ